MARIVGVDIPNEKVVSVSLTYIYGIGNILAHEICATAKVDPQKRVKKPPLLEQRLVIIKLKVIYVVSKCSILRD